MQLGIFVDGTVDANEKTVRLEIGQMILEIKPRAIPQSGAMRSSGLIEHSGSTGIEPRATYHDPNAISYSICAARCITLSDLSGVFSQPSSSSGPMVTQTMQTIDVHAHILTEETIRLLQREAPKVGPKLSEIGDQFATLDVAGNVYRHFPRGGWDLERRLQDMAASKVDVQVLSVCPQTFVYAQPPALAAAFARIQNEQLAKLAKSRPDRFLAIATLPMQAPERAAERSESPTEVATALAAASREGGEAVGRRAGPRRPEPRRWRSADAGQRHRQRQQPRSVAQPASLPVHAA